MNVRYAWVTLAFAAFFTAFFAPALFGGNYLTVAGDGSNLALPAYLVPHGWWEPDIMLGYPWASNLNGYWDPLFLLHFIPHSFNAYMQAAYVIAAVGAFGCVDALTRSTVGGVVAGVSYALGGFMIGHLGHYDVVHPAAWAPYVFWALIVQRRERGLRPVALGGVALALCALAGQPQVFAYTLLFAVVYIAVAGSGGSDRRRYIAGAAASLLLGIGLAAIALVPGALLASQSFRAQASAEYFLSFSVPVWQLPVRLLLPYVVGRSNQPLYPFSSADNGPDAEYSGYVGIITLIFALIAVLARRADRNVLFFAAAALVALMLSAGDGFHIAAITFHIPVFNLFRAQGRNMFEFTLFASLLGGIGAAEIARGTVQPRQIHIAVALIGVALAGAVLDALHSGVLSGPAADAINNPAFVVPIVVFVIASIVIVAYPRLSSARLAAALVIVCTVADLSTFAWFEYWRTPVSEAVLQPAPATLMLHDRLERTHQRMFSVAGATTLEGIPPNLSLVWGVPAAGGYVQLLLTSPGIFLQLFPQGTIAPALLANGADRSLDLAAVRYAVIAPGDAAGFMAARPAWRLLQQSEIGTILENTHAEPRARIVHRVEQVPVDQALQAIRQGALDTNAIALIPSGGTLATQPDPADAAIITALHSDDMQLNVTCRTPCFLVTSDNYNSMWRASIDGARVPLLLTDYTLRGVFVPAGTHTVAFTYRPWIIWLGAAITLVCACVIGALALLRRPRTGGIAAR